MKRTLSILSMSFVLIASLISPIAMAEDALDIQRSDLCAEKMNYSDVDQDDWFHDSACTLRRMGAIDKANRLYPHEDMTRMEVMKVALIAGGYQIREVSGITFKDADETSWYWEVATTAHSLGFMNGYDGYLRPNDPITRGELVTVIMRMHNKELWGWDDRDIYFRDVDSDDFFAYATIYMHNKGLISGYGDRTFRGYNDVSRGEAFEIITKSEQVWPNDDWREEAL